jgi:hypothetical protein
MTLGPALILLAGMERMKNSLVKPVIVFGSVPFFFYILHLYIIHALAVLLLVYEGHDWHQYILSARAIASGALRNFGLNLGIVYLIWIFVIVLMYLLCRGYQTFRQNHPAHWWLRYL